MAVELSCPECESPLANAAQACPECGIGLVLCTATACGKYANTAYKACGECGAALVKAAASVSVPGSIEDLAEAERKAFEEFARKQTPTTTTAASFPASMDELTPDERKAFEEFARQQPVPTTSATVRSSAPADAATVRRASTQALKLLAETQSPAVSRVGQVTYFAVKAGIGGGASDLRLQVEIGSAHFPPELQCFTATPGQVVTFEAVRFTPISSGTDLVRLRFVATTLEGVPVAAWVGDCPLNVEAVEAAIQIHHTGTGEFTYYEAGRKTAAIAAQQASWKSLHAVPDAAFARRVTRLRPASGGGLSGLTLPAGAAFIARQDASGHRMGVAALRGRMALLGRGGDRNRHVQWWVLPEPLDPAAANRISGAHFALTLLDGYAWLEDQSKFGTRINGQPIPPKQPVVLADNDTIDLVDGIIGFTVTLSGTPQAVESILLRRRDGHRERLQYWLCSGGASVPGLPGQQMRWHATAGGVSLRSEGSAGTVEIADGDSKPVGSAGRLSWRSQNGPRHQAADVAAVLSE